MQREVGLYLRVDLIEKVPMFEGLRGAARGGPWGWDGSRSLSFPSTMLPVHAAGTHGTQPWYRGPTGSWSRKVMDS